LSDYQELQADLLKNDLAVYRGLENWGATLFLGGLALLGKQFIEWELTPELSKRIVFSGYEFLLPAAVGLVAFAFLRIVNARSHTTATALINLARTSRTRRFGALGWLIALMPLALGSAISCFLSYFGVRGASFRWLVVCADFAAIGTAAYYDHRLRKP
jgi:hypothetical protein